MKIQRFANRLSSARASKRCRRFLSAICMSEVMTKWHSLIEAASWKNCWSCKNLFTICDERRSAKEDGAQEDREQVLRAALLFSFIYLAFIHVQHAPARIRAIGALF